MSALDVGGIISGFDEARRSYRDAEMKNAHAREDREFSILQALAQHIDPEIAAVGASALLGMVGENGPKVRKGLSGFMGEIEKSGHLDPLRQFLGAGPASAPAQPGSAAQPDTALIEPEAQRGHSVPGVGAGATAPTFGASGGTQPKGATAPTFGAAAPQNGVGGTTPPDFGGNAPLQMAGAMPAGPPPPETPQARMTRLFPSAADIAEQTRYQELRGRLDAVMQAIRAAKTEDERDIVRGIAGAPRRTANSKPINAQYRTQDGQELEGTVIFDPVAQTAEVDGMPVTILKMLPTNAPRPIRQRMNTGGTYTDVYLNPNDFEVQAKVETGIPVSGPPPYQGTVTTGDGIYQVNRGGGTGPRLGDAPPRAGELNPEQQQATGWLADVQAEVKAALSQFNMNRPGGMKATSLPVAQQNTIVQRVTKNRYKTVGELTAATKRTGATSGAPGSDGGMRDRANRVRQRLESADPSRVQGSGLPPGM